MDRISSSTLRLVVIALGGCAVVGGWMGLSDSLRRSAPAWDQHGVAGGPTPTAGSVPEAVAFDPKAVEKAPPTQAPPPVKAETKVEIVPEPADPAVAAATPPGATPPAKTPPGTPKATPKAAPKGDPIADVIQEKTAPAPKAEPPPEVPF